MEQALAIIGVAILLWMGWAVLRRLPRAQKAREAYRRHRYKMLRDGYFCVKCGYNTRGCTGNCAECGWPLDRDPE